MNAAAAGNVPAAPASATTLALEVEALTVAFTGRRGQVPIVTGADLALARREILGVVGESGSGKSLTSLAIMRLLDPSSVRVVAARCACSDATCLLCPSGRCAQCGAGRSG